MDERTERLLQAVRALPPRTVEVPRGDSLRRFTGPLLHDYLSTTGQLAGRPAALTGSRYVMATAADGFRAAIAMAEIAPAFTQRQVILAYEMDGEPLRVGLRLIVPGDIQGGRSILGVVDIDVRAVDSALPNVNQRPPAGAVEVRGLVERPARLDLDGLSHYPEREAASQPTPRHGGNVAPGRRYGGVPVYALLAAAGIVLNPGVSEDFLGKIVVARSTEGYAAVVAAGEIDPLFFNGDVLVATSADGAPLGPDEGRFRLVVPYDHAIGRAVKNLASIELRDG